MNQRQIAITFFAIVILFFVFAPDLVKNACAHPFLDFIFFYCAWKAGDVLWEDIDKNKHMQH